MSALFDSLARLFTEVMGRPPKGAAVSEKAVAATLAACRAELGSRLSMDEDDLPDLRVPAVYLEFWRRFGGERSLTDKVATLYPPDRLRTTSSHLVLGAHLHSNLWLGLDHFVLEDDDPAAMCGDAAEIEEAEEDEDADGSEGWQDFTDTLSECLIEVAADNLLNSLEFQASFSDCDEDQLGPVLASLESVYGKKVSKVSAPTLVYFGPGVLLNYERGTGSALVGFDTAKRKQDFCKRFPEAER